MDLLDNSQTQSAHQARTNVVSPGAEVGTGKQHSVYVIECQRFVKIGRASNVEERLAALKTGNPFPMRVAHTYGPHTYKWAHNIEVRAHLALREYAHMGEWFACGADTAHSAIMAIIERLNGHLPGDLYSPRSRKARFLAVYDIKPL